MEPYTGYLREKRKSLFEEENLPQISENFENITAETTDYIDENSSEILVDMRSYVSYELGHIKGSLNFPFEDSQKISSERLFAVSQGIENYFYLSVWRRIRDFGGNVSQARI